MVVITVIIDSKSMKRTFIWSSILFFVAIVITYLSVVTDFDWKYFQFLKNYNLLQKILFPAVMIGGFLPMILSLMVMILFWKFRSRNWFKKMIKIFFALVFAVIIDSILKSITGRPAPSMAVGLIDNSQIFKFGFMRGGIFWGWPSEHAMVAFAMSTVFAKLNSSKWYWPLLAYLYGFYIATGVSLRIHWFSDALSGVLIGYAIGLLIVNFKSKLFGNNIVVNNG